MPALTSAEIRRHVAAARVARLATADRAGRPHLVPCTFVVHRTDSGADVIYSAVDAKPKRTTALRRLANVSENPAVALLVDHYDDADWNALWWVRADGAGRVLDPSAPEAQQAITGLVDRYRQYRSTRPRGPVLAIDVLRWSGWAGHGTGRPPAMG